jgi:hypothetical protein
MKKEVIIEDKKYYVAKPGAKEEAQAKLQQSKVFSEALQNGACLKSHLNKILKERSVWDENDDKIVEDLSNKIRSNLDKLEEGGIDIMEARKLAIETNELRSSVINKLSVLRENSSLTAEGQADDAYFDSLVSNCCFNEDGTKVFKSYDDYINKSDQDYSIRLARELSGIVYGSLDYVKEFPENKFLSEFGFINDNLEYVNENGELVDENYKVVVKEEKKERKPFLKDGQPI